MKHLMKRSLALLCMLALLLSVLPAAIAAEGETEFVVLSTTDMHGRTWDRNVLNDTNMNNSMLNVATAVAKMRETYGDNVVLGEIKAEGRTQLSQNVFYNFFYKAMLPKFPLL